MNYPPLIQKLIDFFSQFPNVGPRMATRFVFYLISREKPFIKDFALNILEIIKKIKICRFCFQPFQPQHNQSQIFCPICSDPTRDKNILCVIASEIDLFAIEKTKRYKGRYFILGGYLSTFKKADLEKLRIKELQERVKNNPQIKEIILAFNLTPEGEATILYLQKILKSLGKKITILGRGLPRGGEIEYADEDTLSFALSNRQEI